MWRRSTSTVHRRDRPPVCVAVCAADPRRVAGPPQQRRSRPTAPATPRRRPRARSRRAERRRPGRVPAVHGRDGRHDRRQRDDRCDRPVAATIDGPAPELRPRLSEPDAGHPRGREHRDDDVRHARAVGVVRRRRSAAGGGCAVRLSGTGFALQNSKPTVYLHEVDPTGHVARTLTLGRATGPCGTIAADRKLAVRRHRRAAAGGASSSTPAGATPRPRRRFSTTRSR